MSGVLLKDEPPEILDAFVRGFVDELAICVNRGAFAFTVLGQRLE